MYGITKVTIQNTNTDKNIKQTKINSIGINTGSFQECESLTDVNILNGVDTIEDLTFEGCINLQNITILTNLNSIGYGAFRNCSNIQKIVLSDNNEKYGLKTFNRGAYVYKKGINEFSAVESLAYGEIKLEKTETISRRAFYSCSSLKSVNITNNIKEIGEEAFTDCQSLTSVNIPNSVTIIDKGAFSHCRSLIEINIPSSVSIINRRAFDNCYQLRNIYFNWNESELDKIIEMMHETGGASNPKWRQIFVVNQKLNINKRNTIIHISKNASDELYQKYKDNFKEYKNSTDSGMGLDSYSTDWKRDIVPPTPEQDINLTPILGGVFGGITLVGLIAGGIVFYKRKRDK